jgi:WD40 repeat protein
MFRRSSSQSSGYQRPRDTVLESATARGRVRFPFLSWARMVGLGVMVWGLVSLANEITPAASKAGPELLGKHSERIESIAFHPGGRWLASGGGGGLVSLWDMHRRELAMALLPSTELDNTHVNYLAFTPDGLSLAVAHDDGSVTILDMATGKDRHRFRVSMRSARCLAFSPDGRLLAIGSTDNKIALWEVPALRQRAVLLGSRRQVNSLAFSPDGRTLASASTDGTAKLWNVSSGENIRTLGTTPINFRTVVCVAYSPEGRILATACPESGIALWDASTGRRLETSGGRERGAMTLAFSPVGGKLAWGTTDGRIEVWDAGANLQFSEFHGHSGAVVSLAFSPDGKTLASTGNDAAVRTWEVSRWDQ